MLCPWCGASKWDSKEVKGGLVVQTCENCGYKKVEEKK